MSKIPTIPDDPSSAADVGGAEAQLRRSNTECSQQHLLLDLFLHSFDSLIDNEQLRGCWTFADRSRGMSMSRQFKDRVAEEKIVKLMKDVKEQNSGLRNEDHVGTRKNWDALHFVGRELMLERSLKHSGLSAPGFLFSVSNIVLTLSLNFLFSCFHS